MITRDFIEQDMQLQRYAATPQEKKPRYNWADVAKALDETLERGLIVQAGDRRVNFDIGEIADTVGNAVTDLALSRDEEDIFNEENRRLVARISRSVTKELVEQHSGDDGQIVVSTEEIADIIDRALIRTNSHDIAKSLVIRRKTAPTRRTEGGELALDDLDTV